MDELPSWQATLVSADYQGDGVVNVVLQFDCPGTPLTPISKTFPSVAGSYNSWADVVALANTEVAKLNASSAVFLQVNQFVGQVISTI